MSRKALDNPNYTVEFLKYPPSRGEGAGQLPQTLLAHLPEQIQIAFHSDYEPVYANALNQGVVGFLNQASRDVFGFSGSSKYLSQQLWISSSPLDISMQLVFDARDSAQADVMQKVETLSRWCMPTRDGLILYSPAPSSFLTGENTSNKLSMRIGKFLYLEEVVLVSVSSDLPILPDKYGKPIAATVDVQLKTMFTPAADDVTRMFQGGGLPDPSSFSATSARTGDLTEQQRQQINGISGVGNNVLNEFFSNYRTAGNGSLGNRGR